MSACRHFPKMGKTRDHDARTNAPAPDRRTDAERIEAWLKQQNSVKPD